MGHVQPPAGRFTPQGTLHPPGRPPPGRVPFATWTSVPSYFGEAGGCPGSHSGMWGVVTCGVFDAPATCSELGWGCGVPHSHW